MGNISSTMRLNATNLSNSLDTYTQRIYTIYINQLDDLEVEMYHVTIWDTQKVYRSFEKLAIAKRYARGLGHNGVDSPGLTGYPPIAFVANGAGECVYNPRFSKRISSAAGGIVNSSDDCLRG